jgi:hypothetical protein
MHPAPSPHPATARTGRRALATWLQPQRAEGARHNRRLPPALAQCPQAGSAATTTFAPTPKIFGVKILKISNPLCQDRQTPRGCGSGVGQALSSLPRLSTPFNLDPDYQDHYYPRSKAAMRYHRFLHLAASPSGAASAPGRLNLPGVFVLNDDLAEAKHLRLSHLLDFPVV